MKKQNINYDNRKFLYEAILQLKNMEECEAFFEDLCTVQELASISQRLVVAKLLTEDKVYSDIVEKTSASTATISSSGGSSEVTSIFSFLPKGMASSSSRAMGAYSG